MEKIYTLENLGCANCAAKMENKLNTLPEIGQATITFATKQLKITAANPDALLNEIQSICAAIESDVIVTAKKRTTTHEHAHSGHEEKHALREIGVSSILFIIAQFVLPAEHFATILLFVVTYLILGHKVLLTAGKNLTRGHIFDENFLMSIATLGAFAIREYPEAVGVMLFFRIGEYFEHRAVAKSRSQIMSAIDLRPETVTLLNGKETLVIAADAAKVNDLLLIKPGDRIPLDGKIIDGDSRLDTSPINGEPIPVKVTGGDSIFSGCINLSGVLTLKVEKALADSMVSRILDSVENAAANKPQIDRFITKFARIYTPIVLLIAIMTAIIPSLITGNWEHYIYIALTFLVISCPCALVLSVPLTFFSGIGAGSKLGILFKGGNSLEAMKNIKAIVMDKTGTITKGNFVLQKIHSFNAMSELELLALCASAESSSTHPIATSIINAAKEKSLAIIRPEAIEEIAGRGIKATLGDKEVLCGNMKLMEHFAIGRPDRIPEEDFGTKVWLAVNREISGYFLIADTLKDDAKESISAIKAMGIKTVMLTGDVEESALAVAKATGIEETYAKLLPQEKLQKLQEIRAKYGAVMFVGDGINDAPVLAGADVGAAMGTGADAALEAADTVFMTGKMASIVTSLRLSKTVGKIAMQNIVIALGVKLLIMILGLLGYASMWAAVFADTGVSIICILNSIRILHQKSF